MINLIEQIDGTWVVRKAGDPNCVEYFAESLQDAIDYCLNNRLGYKI